MKRIIGSWFSYWKTYICIICTWSVSQCMYFALHWTLFLQQSRSSTLFMPIWIEWHSAEFCDFIFLSFLQGEKEEIPEIPEVKAMLVHRTSFGNTVLLISALCFHCVFKGHWHWRCKFVCNQFTSTNFIIFHSKILHKPYSYWNLWQYSHPTQGKFVTLNAQCILWLFFVCILLLQQWAVVVV